MWVNYNDWLLHASKAIGILLTDEGDIYIYWDGKNDPDVLNFRNLDDSEKAFKKIIEGLENGNKFITI
jgi:hypothetical protein